MKAAGTSEMSVNLHQTTWSCNPEDSHLCTGHCENLILWEFMMFGENSSLTLPSIHVNAADEMHYSVQEIYWT
jgi:hypothetical protein